MYRIQLSHIILLMLCATLLGVNAEEVEPSEKTIKQNISKLLESKQCVECNLMGSDLSGLNLSGVNLTGTKLDNSNLRKTNFRGAKLQGVSMLGVALEETMFAGADLRETNFSDLDIDEVFESVEIIGTLFEGAKFKYGIICGPPPIKGGWGCQHL